MRMDKGTPVPPRHSLIIPQFAVPPRASGCKQADSSPGNGPILGPPPRPLDPAVAATDHEPNRVASSTRLRWANSPLADETSLSPDSRPRRARRRPTSAAFRQSGRPFGVSKPMRLRFSVCEPCPAGRLPPPTECPASPAREPQPGCCPPPGPLPSPANCPLPPGPIGA